ncbi:MAG TPA: plasmid mobilization relaxosome protein MobC [Rhizomicrobium sp.]|nr:plasmid mobilization relaxosome protein MobC [Rhizomicrobium sp.]
MNTDSSEKPHRSGSETRRRRKRLLVRLDNAEYAELVAGAEAARLTLAAYAREKVLSGPVRKPSRRVSPDMVLLARILGALGRIGSNLNQIARALNTGDTRELGDDLAGIAAALTELRTIAAAITQVLG